MECIKSGTNIRKPHEWNYKHFEYKGVHDKFLCDYGTASVNRSKWHEYDSLEIKNGEIRHKRKHQGIGCGLQDYEATVKISSISEVGEIAKLLLYMEDRFLQIPHFQGLAEAISEYLKGIPETPEKE